MKNKTINRSAKSGKFVSEKFAKKHKSTTVKETVNEHTDLELIKKKLDAIFDDNRNYFHMRGAPLFDRRLAIPKIMRLFARAIGNKK